MISPETLREPKLGMDWNKIDWSDLTQIEDEFLFMIQDEIQEELDKTTDEVKRADLQAKLDAIVEEFHNNRPGYGY